MTATLAGSSTRYASTQQHDVARCEGGLSAILGAVCPCQGRLFGARRGAGLAFFAALLAADPHSFQALPSREARLTRAKGRTAEGAK